MLDTYDAGKIDITAPKVEIADISCSASGSVPYGSKLTFRVELKQPINYGAFAVLESDGGTIANLCAFGNSHDDHFDFTTSFTGDYSWRHNSRPETLEKLRLRFSDTQQTWDMMRYIKPVTLLPEPR